MQRGFQTLTVCRHADTLDKLSQLMLEHRNQTQRDAVAVAVKAHGELKHATVEMTNLTKQTFHQVDSELD